MTSDSRVNLLLLLIGYQMQNLWLIALSVFACLLCIQCTTKEIPQASKEEFLAQGDAACSTASKEIKAWIEATQKTNGNIHAAVNLIEKITNRMTLLSRTIEKLPKSEDDADLLKQFSQEDKTLRDLLIRLSEVSKAFVAVWTKSQSSEEERVRLQKKSDEFGAEIIRLQNDVSAQAVKRSRAASRFGFEACALLNPAEAWAKAKAR